jgi:IS30 family transposase
MGIEGAKEVLNRIIRALSGSTIENRPVNVQSRKRIGNIEVDLMMGRNAVSQSIRRILKNETYPLHKLTFHNDKVFAGHRANGIALCLETYLTRPYTSQDKRTVENRIGQFRRFFPQKNDLLEISQLRVRLVQDFPNNRHVRKSNYKTPDQALQGKVVLIS